VNIICFRINLGC